MRSSPTTRLVAALVVALALSACGDEPAPVAQPSPSPSAPPSPSPPALSSPSASPAGDDAVYAYVRRADATSLAYDEVEHLPAECAALGRQARADVERATAACFRDADGPQLRTVRLAADAELLLRDLGSPPQAFPIGQLPSLLTDEANNETPARLRVWRLTLEGAAVVRVEQFPVAGSQPD